MKKQCNSTSEATSKPRLSKAKKTGKSNISLGNGDKKNKEEKKKQMKWSAVYLHKMQEFWDENTGLAIDSNRGPITYL